MAEPDHIIVNPLPNLAHGNHPAAFPFFYIRPDQNEKIVRKFYPEENGPVTNVDPIGNSPVIIRKVNFLIKLLSSYFLRPGSSHFLNVYVTCCDLTMQYGMHFWNFSLHFESTFWAVEMFQNVTSYLSTIYFLCSTLG